MGAFPNASGAYVKTNEAVFPSNSAVLAQTGWQPDHLVLQIEHWHP
jgi:hypothetical protein